MSDQSLTNLEYLTKRATYDRKIAVEQVEQLRRFAGLRAGRVADLCNARADEIEREIERLDDLLRAYSERDRLSRACSALLNMQRRILKGIEIESASDLPDYDRGDYDLDLCSRAVAPFGYTLATLRDAAIARTSARFVDQVFAYIFNMIPGDEVTQ